jgi:hypothetical protein
MGLLPSFQGTNPYQDLGMATADLTFALTSAISMMVPAPRGGLPAGDGWLNTAELRFSQRTAGGGGGSHALRESLSRGWDASRGGVDAIQTRGGLVTFDNTRVAVARELGIEKVSGRIHQLGDPLPEGFARMRGLDVRAKRLGLSEPKTWQDALRIRTMGNKLPLEGTDVPPLLR